MELRQLRYFVRVVELGSLSRAALDLNLVQSALSQQIGRLESELATRLLQRGPKGVTPTEAGLAFFTQAQLTLRHAEQARAAAQQARLSGAVSIGLAPTTAGVLGLPLFKAMRARYPDVRLHVVEALSGHLAQMLDARQLDLAVLFGSESARRWSVQALLQERLYLIEPRSPTGQCGEQPPMALRDLHDRPLILPTHRHGLRSTLETAFGQTRLQPQIAGEIDSLTLLMDSVSEGLAATIQPWSAMVRYLDYAQRFRWTELLPGSAGVSLHRVNDLCCLSDDELSPAALATRVQVLACVRELLSTGRWPGATTLL